MYYLMSADYAEPLLATPSGACPTANDKLLISGDRPKDFQGDVIELDPELTNDELNDMVDYLLASEFTGKLIIITYGQGQYLYKNHPSFIPKQVE